MSESLWKSSDPPRFFVIPDDFAAPPGDLTIRSLTGERRMVDPAAIASYERTQEQVTEWLQGKVGKVLEGVRGWIDNVADRLTGVDDDPLGALREAVDRTQHLAALIAAEPSRFRGPADVQTIQKQVKKLRDLAERLDAAAIQAVPPI
jgi:hypothetical protein